MNYLIFDIETYPDKALVEGVYGRSYAKVKEEAEHLLHPIYHIPIVIGGLVCDEQLQIKSFGAKCGGPEKEHDTLKFFWETFERYGGGKRGPQCVLVTFNGRCFDLPVIEHRSLGYGLGSAAYFNNRDKFANYRYRFAPDFHFDIVEFLTNYGAAPRTSLDAVAKLLGLPGKTRMDGASIEAEYEHGNLKAIGDYCMCDVALTYFIFLECQRMRGGLRGEADKVRSAAIEYFRGQLKDRPFLQELVQAAEAGARRQVSGAGA
jgi:predicted PolB exonuclease-like 3'-5' exonuclease